MFSFSKDAMPFEMHAGGRGYREMGENEGVAPSFMDAVLSVMLNLVVGVPNKSAFD